MMNYNDWNRSRQKQDEKARNAPSEHAKHCSKCKNSTTRYCEEWKRLNRERVF